MTEPYLIAHKVRGVAAFDVAIHMTCPLCPNEGHGCHECDGLGYWWIVPTSGHRAYPYTHWAFSDIELSGGPVTYFSSYMEEATRLMPEGIQDHYPDRGIAPKINLIEALGLKPAAPAKIERRL